MKKKIAFKLLLFLISISQNLITAQQQIYIAIRDHESGKSLKKAIVSIIDTNGNSVSAEYSRKEAGFIYDLQAYKGAFAVDVSCNKYAPSGKLFITAPNSSKIQFSLRKGTRKTSSIYRGTMHYEELPQYVHIEFNRNSSREKVLKLLDSLSLQLSRQSMIYQKKEGGNFLRYFDQDLKALRNSPEVSIAQPVIRLYSYEFYQTQDNSVFKSNYAKSGSIFPLTTRMLLFMHPGWEPTSQNILKIKEILKLHALQLVDSRYKITSTSHLKSVSKNFRKNPESGKLELVEESDDSYFYKSPIIVKHSYGSTGLGILDVLDTLDTIPWIRNPYLYPSPNFGF